MEYPQLLCVVSNDHSFIGQISPFCDAAGIAMQRVGDWGSMLGLDDTRNMVLLVDAGLSVHGSTTDAKVVFEWLLRRPVQGLILSRSRQNALQAGTNPLDDVLVKQADELLDQPVLMDQLAFVLQSVMRKHRARLERSVGVDQTGMGDAGKRWQFDPVAMVLIPPEGESFALSASEARLIAMLITKDPEPVRREDLIELFGIRSPNIRRIDTTVYRLRHKIEQNTGYQSPFSTVHGIGYRNDGLTATVPLSF